MLKIKEHTVYLCFFGSKIKRVRMYPKIKRNFMSSKQRENCVVFYGRKSESYLGKGLFFTAF
jgi:hypothetical protein